MNRISATKAAMLAASCCALLGACDGQPKTPASQAPTADLTKVRIPQPKLGPGDVMDPLPAGSPSPSPDPRNLEGIWVGLGMAQTADGKPPPSRPEVRAAVQRARALEESGTPVVTRGSLCRPVGVVSISGNQFPTQILQRPDKILIVSEEHRGIWPIYMNVDHPADVKPSYVGHNVGRWEGNTLVIDTVAVRPKGIGLFGASPAGHVVTRITRGNTGDKANGDRLVIEQTVDDPAQFIQTFTNVNVARWRPDLQMLEFNCEESAADMLAKDLTVE